MDELRVFEIWHIPVALVLPGILLLVISFLTKKRWLGFGRVPQPARMPMAFGIASLSTCVMLFALTRPTPSAAVESVDVVEMVDADVKYPHWPLRIYGFEDWGDRCRQEKIAAVVRRRLTDTLIERELLVRVGREPVVPTQLYEGGRQPSARELEPFRPLVPFASVTGVVGTNTEGLYEVKVWVHWIDENVRARQLLEKAITTNDPLMVIGDLAGAIDQLGEDFRGVVPGR
jgi:hypothetical protein